MFTFFLNGNEDTLHHLSRNMVLPGNLDEFIVVHIEHDAIEVHSNLMNSHDLTPSRDDFLGILYFRLDDLLAELTSDVLVAVCVKGITSSSYRDITTQRHYLPVELAEMSYLHGNTSSFSSSQAVIGTQEQARNSMLNVCLVVGFSGSSLSR